MGSRLLQWAAVGLYGAAGIGFADGLQPVSTEGAEAVSGQAADPAPESPTSIQGPCTPCDPNNFGGGVSPFGEALGAAPGVAGNQQFAPPAANFAPQSNNLLASGGGSGQGLAPNMIGDLFGTGSPGGGDSGIFGDPIPSQTRTDLRIEAGWDLPSRPLSVHSPWCF